eukprot:NODE_24511_length_622_cov_1.684848.p5 GENE.NODE_24511_length_622_cov_1.684848~~NODE_24511_length_622_cov_1.684848.p5  ORF type:complete len:64 (+),score=8.47 NODE_24511_length_622_cov_1.684848:42-233(+)
MLVLSCLRPAACRPAEVATPVAGAATATGAASESDDRCRMLLWWPSSPDDDGASECLGLALSA